MSAILSINLGQLKALILQCKPEEKIELVRFLEEETFPSRFKQFLNSLDHIELVNLKQQLDKGSVDLDKEVKQKIQEHERKHHSFCATCSTDLDPFSDHSFTLLFGAEDFKRKASFCAQDCLEYFLTNYKEQKTKLRE